MTVDSYRPWSVFEDEYLRGVCEMATEMRSDLRTVLRVAARTLSRDRAAVRARIAVLGLWTKAR